MEIIHLKYFMDNLVYIYASPKKKWGDKDWFPDNSI